MSKIFDEEYLDFKRGLEAKSNSILPWLSNYLFDTSGEQAAAQQERIEQIERDKASGLPFFGRGPFKDTVFDPNAYARNDYDQSAGITPGGYGPPPSGFINRQPPPIKEVKAAYKKDPRTDTEVNVANTVLNRSIPKREGMSIGPGHGGGAITPPRVNPLQPEPANVNSLAFNALSPYHRMQMGIQAPIDPMQEELRRINMLKYPAPPGGLDNA